ncbi:Lysine exporter protein (LYSE/YGGA) [Methanosalsum zhilinae DSM 4017]|uniref:Lysine exporter protein (LYSE/YGGA) n=1 Tax=Methanosalsum zhilinae (strain DSM 4017 / NBRC 107636 / OCM 62 / WeN5) TaxID=679901 RepID=F7XLT1_METZD|nr:LysE family translocator [Methanosalsum zhilinae]AEH61012.1 Lysine exporter protein (LYSE/YGGA) [Methanosalsum zhilinae DSM 4017]
MLDIIDLLIIGFLVGLSGALVPGPMLFATIDSSLRNGWIAGPKVVAGHSILELLIIILIVFGLFSFTGDSLPSYISITGGIVLVLFGLMTARSGYHSIEGISMTSDVNNIGLGNPYIAGIITSASNPYFWMWWITAGAALLFYGLDISLLAMVFFVIGHWLADMGWYSMVSIAFSRGKALMTDSMYRIIVTGCGLFLVIFGAWFIFQ